jgi:DeoR family transcriptional regulator of aga operon
MLRHERLSAVLELVAQRGSLRVEDVVDAFDISAATARRDLDDLATQQLITRTRGGAVAHTVTYDLPLRYKSSRQPDQKRRIAAAAATLIEPGAVIGLNGGTTNTEVARSLATRAGNSDSRSTLASVTVVTNALNIANELAVRPQVKMVVIGGVLRPQSFELSAGLLHNLRPAPDRRVDHRLRRAARRRRPVRRSGRGRHSGLSTESSRSTSAVAASRAVLR